MVLEGLRAVAFELFMLNFNKHYFDLFTNFPYIPRSSPKQPASISVHVVYDFVELLLCWRSHSLRRHMCRTYVLC